MNDALSRNLPKDRKQWMIGNLNMNNNKIINVGTPTTKDNAANKEYVDTEISEADNKNKQVIDRLKKMSSNLDMNNKDIINLNEPQPYNSYYAANVNVVNKSITNNNVSITSAYKNQLMTNSNIQYKAQTHRILLSVLFIILQNNSLMKMI